MDTRDEGGGGDGIKTLYFIKPDNTSGIVIKFNKDGTTPNGNTYKNCTFKWVDQTGKETPYIIKGGARRTRHRANKPVKTRKHRNHGANRNTRKRHPRKTIRK
jgi:hypothetical protein